MAPTDSGAETLYRAVLASAVALLVVLGLPIFFGQVYANDDLAIFHLPWRFIYAQALGTGGSLLWFPHIFGGFFAHGEGQAGLLHPVHLALYAGLPLNVAFNVELLLNYVGLLAGTFVWLRRLELDRAPAMFGALVFTFSGFNLMHFVHPNLVAVIAHTPWLLVAIDVAMRDTEPRRLTAATLGIGLLTVSQVLLGHPQAVWLSGVIEALYAMILARRAAQWTRLLSVAAGKSLGVLAAAVQILPTREVVAESARAALTASGAAVSLVPADIVQLVAPYLAANRGFGAAYPREVALYAGAAAVTLALWAVMRIRVLNEGRALAKGALALAALGLVLALGSYGYLFLLERYIPVVNLFRSPVRYILLVHLGVAMLAAVGFADVMTLARRSPAGGRTPGLRPLAMLTLASVTVAAIGVWMRDAGTVPAVSAQLASVPRILAGPVLIGAAAALVAAAARGARWALPALVVFAAVDQGYYGISALRDATSPVSFDAFVQGQAAPPSPSPHRVQSDNNILVMQGWQLAGGYNAFRPARVLDPLDAQRLRLAGVEWVQLRTPWARTTGDTTDPPGWRDRVGGRFETHDSAGGTSIWTRVLDPMPRARLVSNQQVSDDPRRDVDAIDIRTTAMAPTTLGVEGAPPGTIQIVDDRPGRIRLSAVVPSVQLLVLTESWHSGWQVSVNDRPENLVRAYGDFIGVLLGEGTHRIDFRFRPDSVRLGSWLSALGLALLVLLAAVPFMPRAKVARMAPAPPAWTPTSTV